MNTYLTEDGILTIGNEHYGRWPDFRPLTTRTKGGFRECWFLLDALTADDLHCWAWRQNIPAEVVAAVVSYPYGHAELLQCAAVAPSGFLRLYRSCPASLLMISAYWAFDRESDGEPAEGEKQNWQKRMLQDPIGAGLPAIGLDARKEMLRTFGKIPPQMCYEYMLVGFREVLGKRRAARLLRYLPTLNEEVLFLLGAPRPIYDPHLLSLAANEPIFGGRRLHDLVWEIIDNREKRRGRPYWPYRGRVRTWIDLFKVWDRNDSDDRYFLPAPPVPVDRADRYGLNLEPLRTEHEVREEGRVMQNCSRDYLEAIVFGEMYLYRLLEPERATVRLKKASDGGWQVAEAQLMSNASEVSADTSNRLFEWLFDSPTKIPANKKSL